MAREIADLVSAGMTPVQAVRAATSVAAELLDLDEAGVAGLARAAVHASYADADVKARILGEIDGYAAG